MTPAPLCTSRRARTSASGLAVVANLSLGVREDLLQLRDRGVQQDRAVSGVLEDAGLHLFVRLVDLDELLVGRVLRIRLLRGEDVDEVLRTLILGIVLVQGIGEAEPGVGHEVVVHHGGIDVSE